MVQLEWFKPGSFDAARYFADRQVSGGSGFLNLRRSEGSQQEKPAPPVKALAQKASHKGGPAAAAQMRGRRQNAYEQQWEFRAEAEDDAKASEAPVLPTVGGRQASLPSERWRLAQAAGGGEKKVEQEEEEEGLMGSEDEAPREGSQSCSDDESEVRVGAFSPLGYPVYQVPWRMRPLHNHAVVDHRFENIVEGKDGELKEYALVDENGMSLRAENFAALNVSLLFST